MTRDNIIILDNAIQYLNRFLFRNNFKYVFEYIDKQKICVFRDCEIDSKENAINKLRASLNKYDNLSYVKFVLETPIYKVCKLFEPIDEEMNFLESSPFADPLFFINNWLHQFKPNGMEYRVYRLSNGQVKVGYSNLFGLDEVEDAITEAYNEYCDDCNNNINDCSIDLLLITDSSNKIIEKFELFNL
jgi:hypothetical protein